MGVYSQKILPYLQEWGMSNPVLTQFRQSLLAEVQGSVLEIGFGTGLNLPYYSNAVYNLTVIDANPGMNRLAQQRIEESPLPVDHQVLNGETLPIANNQFDSVVSTWTLCSITQVEQALQEIYRVLKPGGRFFFVEHGLSPDPGLQAWQHRLTPIQKVIADGCHFNRNIRQLVEKQFDHVTIDEFYVKKLPKIGGYFYQGVASKASA